MQQPEAEFFAALINAGMREIPGQFSVVPYPQLIPSAMLAEIDTFIRAFDRVACRYLSATTAERTVVPVVMRSSTKIIVFQPTADRPWGELGGGSRRT
jgi:hypothetical protein